MLRFVHDQTALVEALRYKRMQAEELLMGSRPALTNACGLRLPAIYDRARQRSGGVCNDAAACKPSATSGIIPS